jgi:hypothetical protein
MNDQVNIPELFIKSCAAMVAWIKNYSTLLSCTLEKLDIQIAVLKPKQVGGHNMLRC